MNDKGWNVHLCTICGLPCDCNAFSEASCYSCDACARESDDESDWDDDDDD